MGRPGRKRRFAQFKPVAPWGGFILSEKRHEGCYNYHIIKKYHDWAEKTALRLCAFFVAFAFGNLKVQAAQSVALAWDANTASDIAGYRLYAGTTSGVYTQQIDVGNNTSTLLSNLIDGTTYFFAVTDYTTSAVESARSNEVSYTAPLATPSPTPIPTPTPTPDPTPTPTPTPSPTPTPTPDPTPTPTPTHLRSTAKADFNGDHKSDILWQDNATGERAIWLMNGSSYSRSVNLGVVPTQWEMRNH